VRGVQSKRFGPDSTTLNGRMNTRELRQHCVLDAEGQALLRAAMDQLNLSARAHDRILRVARTIADLEGEADLRAPHVVEAIGYRSLDRKLWQS
jgi:magnesium chelatase family protein